MIKLGFFGAFFGTVTTFFVFGFTGTAATSDFLTVVAQVGGNSLQKIKKKKKKIWGEIRTEEREKNNNKRERKKKKKREKKKNNKNNDVA